MDNSENPIKIFLKGIHPSSLSMGISSVIIGSAAAAAVGQYHFMPAVLALLFACFCQANMNLGCRYLDIKHNSLLSREELSKLKNNPVSKLNIYREGMKVCTILEATVGLAILSLVGWWTLIFAAFTIIFMTMSNIGRHPISRTAFYPIVAFFVFGPLGVSGTALIENSYNNGLLISHQTILSIVYMSIISGLLAANCHILYSITKRKKDLETKRDSIATKLRPGVIWLILGLSYGIATFLSLYAPQAIGLHHDYALLPIPAFGFLAIGLSMAKNRNRAALQLATLVMMLYAASIMIIFPIAYYC